MKGDFIMNEIDENSFKNCKNINSIIQMNSLIMFFYVILVYDRIKK